ncbi:serine--tRNA synthetase-like protein Slimp [Physella acuta]|uniref:serine--tRNA synthetase-like protein Slimp n=1 Tax=Physella acuta TaxID=109671 RepID=UPI0027DB0F62|nr:serine--tRNA synthetase-like protein Slimp [Physella acuta]
MACLPNSLRAMTQSTSKRLLSQSTKCTRKGITYSRLLFFNHSLPHSRPFCAAQPSLHQKITFENQPLSWLFVSDSVAGAYGAQVNLELDLDRRLTEETYVNLMVNNVNLREMDIDVYKLAEDFKQLKQKEKEKSDLIAEKQRVAEELQALKNKESDPSTQPLIQEAVQKLFQLKQAIVNTPPFWELEESVILRALKLPNDLHPDTPHGESTILKEKAGVYNDVHNKLSHVEIGKKFDLIKFSNVGPKAYYLKKDLAVAEMELITTVVEYMQAQHFYFIAAPEFFKTPILEGCGLNIHDPSEVFTMIEAKENIEPMIHLTGVSPASFIGYVAKTCIGDKSMPLNMFACGRTYQNCNLPGLYGAVQSNQVGLFSCVKEEDVNRQMVKLTNLIWTFLEGFGFPLRMCQANAKNLKVSESRRVDFEVYAPGIQQYVTVASVADLGDYVSRRLMVTHNLNHSDIRSSKIVHMLSGVALNITSLLAVWTEHSNSSQETFSLCPLPPGQKIKTEKDQ